MGSGPRRPESALRGLALRPYNETMLWEYVIVGAVVGAAVAALGYFVYGCVRGKRGCACGFAKHCPFSRRCAGNASGRRP